MTRSARQSTASTFGRYALLVVVTAIFFAPVYYLIIGSLKPSGEVLDGLAGFLPVHLSLDNYFAVFGSLSNSSTGYLLQFVGNSLVVTAVVVGLGLVVNSMAAYSFARVRWRGRQATFLVVISLIIIPFQAIAVPLLYLLNEERNTLVIQMVPFVANAFSVFLFYSFFLDFPIAVEESAHIDGLGTVGTYFRIVVPNSGPVFASVAILTFLSTWGSFLWPLLVISDPAVRPLPLALAVFSGSRPADWGALFAFGVILILPVTIVFLAFQRFFIQSVASSAVKG